MVNCFIMTQNKVLGLFIFLNFIPKKLFWGKFGSETSKCDGMSITIMQYSPSLQSVIKESLSLSLFFLSAVTE